MLVWGRLSISDVDLFMCESASVRSVQRQGDLKADHQQLFEALGRSCLAQGESGLLLKGLQDEKNQVFVSPTSLEELLSRGTTEAARRCAEESASPPRAHGWGLLSDIYVLSFLLR